MPVSLYEDRGVFPVTCGRFVAQRGVENRSEGVAEADRVRALGFSAVTARLGGWRLGMYREYRSESCGDEEAEGVVVRLVLRCEWRLRRGHVCVEVAVSKGKRCFWIFCSCMTRNSTSKENSR
jgi:hypothetical protein